MKWFKNNVIKGTFIACFFVILIGYLSSCNKQEIAEEYNPYIPGIYTEADIEARFGIDSLMTIDPVNLLAPAKLSPEGILYGDIDRNKELNIVDLTRLITIVKTEPKPFEWIAAVNGDCKINWDDVWYYADYMFAGGDAPQKPCRNPKELK